MMFLFRNVILSNTGIRNIMHSIICDENALEGVSTGQHVDFKVDRETQT